jgi:hypothetical protein
MYVCMAALAAMGTVVAALYGGVPWLAGFLTGAAFSVLNFWFWHRLVSRLGRAQTAQRGSGGSGVLFALRYGIFAGALYVILQYFEASLSAALVGIFVAVAAVLLEILFELLYGTS